ncbi:MAG: hypothetical protein KME52_22805 [Desmonostoc geniculatum HA4340-LM1]|jgi:hypothetical protein|nr:hypothetical protein [Desmonostoc geniculatum HA4340-LM1]
MTKHDTWVKLKPGSPIDPILNLFPDGMIPMRDPFPLERVTDSQNNHLALWIVDLERLSSVQANAIAQIIAHHRGAQPDVVAQEATVLGGFTLSHGWIDTSH